MNILVCVKQVPGSSQVEVDPVTGVLKRDGVQGKLNPFDLFALEAAMAFKEKYGGRVQTLTMGPPQAERSLRETLHMGADGAFLVTDRRFAGADVLATSYTLAQSVGKIEDVDLILCGKQTTDGDTAQVGAELAEFLGLPHLAGVSKMEKQGESQLVVTCNTDHGTAMHTISLPCLLCMDDQINTPRLPSYMRSKNMAEDPIPTWTLDDLLDKDPKRYGLNGSPTQVERIFPPAKNVERALYTGTGEELGKKLAQELIRRKMV